MKTIRIQCFTNRSLARYRYTMVKQQLQVSVLVLSSNLIDGYDRECWYKIDTDRPADGDCVRCGM